MKKPGSKGEHNLQKEFQTEKRALAFYQNQLRPLFRADNSQSMGDGIDLTLQSVKGTVDNF